ncbi:Retrovirus-related Pol polyprotein from transposon RE2 [Vitis vinifera]|uniref:Retrovirus-related Pol polyprotein from transposon RE2 n=1 Tax=Vitis vinifera TaxID=29760 RepID=A0A438GQY3_VITVI|nr:Retrovirus-related Pol polyprotein from transposon RE2 [Vitis vinifera]
MQEEELHYYEYGAKPLTKSGIPKSFWPEAVNWSIYILNRSPTLAVQNMTPEEAWSGRKPAVDYFRIFGCIAYAHILDEKRRKLDNKREKCIFLVLMISQSYKLYNPNTMKIVISHDVQPMENEQEEEVTQNVPIADQSPLIAKSQRPQRVRKKPAWMTNYEVTGVDQEDNWCKVGYKTKLKENGEVDKHKARLVAKGYKQEVGVDYKEVFAPVARHDTIRLVIAMTTQNSWLIFQLDMKSAFLHGDLKEEVFIDQPPGYAKLGDSFPVVP